MVTLVSQVAFAQRDREGYYQQESPTANKLEYVIYSEQYDNARTELNRFLNQGNYFIINQNEQENAHHFEFSIHQSQIPLIDSVCNALGYVGSKELNFYNNEQKLAETALELERLEQLKRDYELMQQRIDSIGSDLYYSHWEKIRGIDTEIYTARKYMKQLETVQHRYTVEVDVRDQRNVPGSSRISFVHMPGAEYVMQFTESPAAGVSYDCYQGVFLKYLFTRGKSYFGLGALKAESTNAADTTAYTEMFAFTFGQDWYSRHFGRGENMFLNPYIGYQTGLTYASSPTNTDLFLFASPAAGLELVKTKYVLLDVNASYNLPLDEKNQHLRAWRVGASFNIVF